MLKDFEFLNISWNVKVYFLRVLFSIANEKLKALLNIVIVSYPSPYG